MTKDEARVLAETINLLSKGKHDGVLPKDMIHMNKVIEASVKILQKYSKDEEMKEVPQSSAPIKMPTRGKSGKSK